MIDLVREYLKKFGIDNKILEFNESSATVELAAHALGAEAGRIAKSMSFDLGDKYIVIVMTGDVKIDNAKYKAEFHQKAKMIPFLEVEEKIGHAAGGVCPFALKSGVEVYLDNSLKKYQTVFPACGSGNSAIELTANELEQYSDNFIKLVEVTKEYE